VGKKFEKSIESSVPVLEPQPLLSLREASRLTGYSPSQLRLYALDGTIPGGRQARKGKRWKFKKDLLERWVQTFNAPKPGEN
jgi:hypothetical protein